MDANPILVLGLMIAMVPSSAFPQQPGGSINELTRASHIIFVGRVEKLHASNVRAVNAAESTGVVRVDQLLDSPAALQGLQGQEVTVEFLRAAQTRPEQQAVFFTNGVLFGEHLEVKEVGSIPVPSDVPGLRKQIAAVRTSVAQEALQGRIADAVLVITGKVLEVKTVERIGPISEHQPDWAFAVVQVEKVLKGTQDSRTVTVYFPQSTDERWLLAPKFQPGEQGIWILHREPNLGLPEGALTALNPLDFRPLKDTALVTRLAR